MTLKDQLVNSGMIVDGNWNPRAARWDRTGLKEAVNQYYFDTVGDYASSISEAAYFVYHGLQRLPVCKNCTGPVRGYLCFLDGYREYCSVKCSKSSPETIATTRDTVQIKYGTSNVSQIKAVKEKRAATMVERYGDEVYYRTDDFKKKSKATLLETYGVEHAMYSPDVAAKISRSAATKTANMSHQNQRRITGYGRRVLSTNHFLIDELKKHTILEIAEKAGVSPQTIYAYCKKRGIPKPRSSYEVEIAHWLESENVPFKQNSKVSGTEIDIVIDGVTGIEFNGLYYHTEVALSARGQNGELYHLNKLKACQVAGIRLIMINEDEWLKRKASIKRKIMNLIGRSERGVGARKLSICKIENRVGNDFVERNHIQGKSAAIIASYGAYHGSELVAVMQYNRQRGTGSVELVRFCTDGRLYAGVFTRLFKYSVMDSGFGEVISFADLRYSDGGVYSKNGFVELGVIKPDYRYVKGTETFHKSTFTKSAISKKFGLDMSALTEREAMDCLGYRRIYDCGKIKYIWRKS